MAQGAAHAITKLNRLLQDPNIRQLLSALTSGSGRSLITREGIAIPEQAVLEAIAEFAQQAAVATGEAHHAQDEYLRDDRGEYTVDIGMPEEKAERLLEVLYGRR